MVVSVIRFGRGVALILLERHTEAIVALDRSIALMPDYPYAWNNKGLALAWLERYDEAIECYDKAAGLKADYWYAHWLKDIANMMSGKKAKSHDSKQMVRKHKNKLFTPPTFHP